MLALVGVKLRCSGPFAKISSPRGVTIPISVRLASWMAVSDEIFGSWTPLEEEIRKLVVCWPGVGDTGNTGKSRRHRRPKKLPFGGGFSAGVDA